MRQAITVQEHAFCKAADEPHGHSYCTDYLGDSEVLRLVQQIV